MNPISRFFLHIILTGVLLTLVIVPNPSLGDVVESPDTTAEDVAGAALIVSNVVASFYLSAELKSGQASTARGILGVGLGSASVVLGILEETSFSSFVGISGAISLGLGITHLVGDGPAEEGQESDFNLSRAISVSPLIVKTEGDQAGLGLLFSAQF
jgi:hypothetical protein